MELPRPLVDAGWLAAHLDDPDLVVADVRWVHGASAVQIRELHEAGHIPGAILVDVDRDLAGVPGGPRGRHPLPAPDAFAAKMSAIGVGDDTAVVVTDDAGGSIAARLWWMLDVTGHVVAVLDGGLEAWPGEVETGPGPSRGAARFNVVAWPSSAVMEPDELVRALREATVTVLDARAGERYRGEAEPIDPVAGHIPGARSAPWSGNLDGPGRFLSPEALRERFGAMGAGDGSVAYCGSGITACHDLLAMRVAGIRGGRLFEPSWSGWVHDPDRPRATGEEPGAMP